jgi:hypothetical protein
MVDIHIPNKIIANVFKIGVLVVMVVMVANFLKPSLTGSLIKDIEYLNSSVTSCKQVVDSQNTKIDMLNSTVNRVTVDLENTSARYD